MPIYVYEREDGSTFEIIQRMSDGPLATCPDTGQKVARQITAATAIFKGSGFYKTDYCGTNGSTATKSSDSGKSAGGEPTTAEKPKACGTGCGCH